MFGVDCLNINNVGSPPIIDTPEALETRKSKAASKVKQLVRECREVNCPRSLCCCVCCSTPFFVLMDVLI